MTNYWTANHCSESDFKSESLNFTTGYTTFIYFIGNCVVCGDSFTVYL